jgi:hypothetical protein
VKNRVKKFAVVVLAMALLMLTLTVASVKAEGAEKVPVAGLSIITGMSPSDDFRGWISDDEIGHLRRMIITSVSLYWMDATSVPNPPLNPTYQFSVYTLMSGQGNYKTDRGVSLWKSVMSYPAVGPVQGTFEGNLHVESVGDVTTMHVIYQGTGIFEGQTLMVSGEKIGMVPGVIEGFLLTR